MRMAGVQPYDGRVLRHRKGHGPEERQGHGLRKHAEARHQGRGRREPESTGLVGGRVGVHLREDLGLPGRARAQHHQRGEPGDDRGQRQVPQGVRDARDVRRGALLRRFLFRLRICPQVPRRGRRRGSRMAGALRHERRHPPGPRGRCRESRMRQVRHCGGHPLPQRFGAGGGMLPCRRQGGRVHGPGMYKRHRREDRERKPVFHNTEPHAQDGPQHERRGPHEAHRAFEVRRRGGQHGAFARPSLCRREGVRT